MKSQTKISKQLKSKTNPELVRTILGTKKKEAWKPVAEVLSSPRKNKIQINLDGLEKMAEEGKTIVVPGKVLGQGELTKKAKIAALSFSGSAKEKLLKNKCEVLTILEELNKNPEGKDIKIVK